MDGGFLSLNGGEMIVGIVGMVSLHVATICILYTYIIYIYIYTIHTFIYIYMCVCVCVCTYVYMYIYIYIYLGVCDSARLMCQIRQPGGLRTTK